MKKTVFLLLVPFIILSCGRRTEVCIYGGTSAAVTAAYSAALKGCDVTLLCPDVTMGGMTTGGLGQTDIGNKQAVTGIARQFYRKLGQHYGKLEQWIFEPHVAEEILMEYLDNPNIRLMQGFFLESVDKEDSRIISITCADSSGKTVTVKADQFIDCSYEGDLMAASGVSYRIGREDNSEYGETYNGSQLSINHQFPDNIDPFVVPGDPDSGLLWGISDWKMKEAGEGDDYVQAYNYRICLTDDESDMIDPGKPDNYDPSRYELLARVLEADESPSLDKYFIWSRMPCHKTDINNRGPFSTDMIGMNHSYPEAGREERERILKEHRDYTLGLLYFYRTDPRVPENIQKEILRWGLPEDEYVRTGHWTHQIYVRECRRMVGEYVATQADCENRTEINDGVGFAAYQMDSHNCERIVIQKDGKYMVKNEGNVEVGGGRPYPISYRSLTPQRGECTNLLVPVCLSATHIAYGSIRMEPVFMEMGQACGLAAAFAGKGAVQDIDVGMLQNILENDPYLDGSEPDTVIDEDSEFISGTENWKRTSGKGSYSHTFYVYDGKQEDNDLVYSIPSSLEGVYDIYAFQQLYGCDTTVFRIDTGTVKESVVFDRKSLVVEGQASGEWVKLGTFDIRRNSGGSIRFTSDSPEIHADAVVFIKK